MIRFLNLSSTPLQNIGLGIADSENSGYVCPARFDLRQQTNINAAVSRLRVLSAIAGIVRGAQNVRLWAEGGALGARTCKIDPTEILAQGIALSKLTGKLQTLGHSVFVPKEDALAARIGLASATRSLSGSRGSPPPALR